MIHEDLQVTGSYQISGSVRIPTGPSASRISQTGSLFFDTNNLSLEGYVGNEWISGSSSGSGGSGGGGGYTPGTFTATDLLYAVIAGGGSGNAYGGGGGAGGMRTASIVSSESVIASGSSFTITVGAGGTTTGANNANVGGKGGNSSIAATGLTTITSLGGGGGGVSHTVTDSIDGGSGGGEGFWDSSGDTAYQGSGTAGQGNDGGRGNGNNDPTWGMGGGGGKGSVGGRAASGGTPGGNGGSGATISWLTSSIDVGELSSGDRYFAAGGAGGAWENNAGGTGGIGGGGNGGRSTFTAGDTNTGGGGGGAGSSNQSTAGTGAGGNGGSGIVIVAYNSSSMGGAGGIVADSGAGRKSHIFYSSDTFVLGNNDDFDAITDNLVIHLDAGDFASRNSTSQWDDLTSNGYDATLVSSPALGNNPYYTFDGSSDYGTFSSTAHTAVSAQTQGTIECWVRQHVISGRDTIFGTGHSSQTDRWCVLRNHSSNGVQLSINGDGTSYGSYTGTSLVANTWTHLAVTSNGSAHAIYVNGVAQSLTHAGSSEGWFNNVGSNTMQVGALDRGSFGNSYDGFDGDIAQLRVYSSPLTAAEVLQNYNATKTNFV